MRIHKGRWLQDSDSHTCSDCLFYQTIGATGQQHEVLGRRRTSLQ